MAPFAAAPSDQPFHAADGAVIDALPVGVYVCDRDARIIRFNVRAVELWGREPQAEDRYCASLRLLRPDGTVLPHDESPMRDVLRTGQAVRDAELGIARPDGSRVVVRATVVPLTDADGEVVGAVNTFEDITEQRQLEAVLRAQERDLQDFVDNATEGLHWVGPDGVILWANQAELDLLGYARDEYIGHHIAEFHAEREVIEDILARLTAGESLRNYEARMRCKDGSLRHVLVNSNVLWREGRFIHTRCFTRDVTDRRRAEELLKETARLKDEFTLTFAHELRQPLAPMVTAVEMLKLSDQAEPRQRALDVLDRQVRQMQRLLDDLLDSARIGTGKIELQRTPLDLRELALQAASTITPLAERRKQQVVLSLPDEEARVEADAHRMQQVLSNLLTNAVKYTPDGGRITVTVEKRGRDVELRVRDTGRGIPADRLPYIFDLFVQVSPHGGGLGIGLSVVRRLIEAHGGTVQARSNGLEQGSEFLVTLPLAGAN